MSKSRLQFNLFFAVFVIIAIIYALNNFAIMQQEIINNPNAIKFLCFVLGSSLLYLSSQLIRALRLRFLISSSSFTTRSAITVQFGSAAIGNISFPLVKDLLAIFLFNYKNPGELSKIIISILYIRFFDFLVITPLLFILVISGSAEKQGIAITLSLIMLGVFFTLILLPRLCKLIIDYLIRFSHTNRALAFIKTLSHLKHNYSSMHLNSFDKAFMVFLLSSFAWATELTAIHLFNSMAYGANLLNSYFSVLNNVLSNIPFIPKEDLGDHLYLYPYLFLLLFFGFFILLKGDNSN